MNLCRTRPLHQNTAKVNPLIPAFSNSDYIHIVPQPCVVHAQAPNRSAASIFILCRCYVYRAFSDMQRRYRVSKRKAHRKVYAVQRRKSSRGCATEGLVRQSQGLHLVKWVGQPNCSPTSRQTNKRSRHSQVPIDSCSLQQAFSRERGIFCHYRSYICHLCQTTCLGITVRLAGYWEDAAGNAILQVKSDSIRRHSMD